MLKSGCAYLKDRRSFSYKKIQNFVVTSFQIRKSNYHKDVNSENCSNLMHFSHLNVKFKKKILWKNFLYFSEKTFSHISTWMLTMRRIKKSPHTLEWLLIKRNIKKYNRWWLLIKHRRNISRKLGWLLIWLPSELSKPNCEMNKNTIISYACLCISPCSLA